MDFDKLMEIAKEFEHALDMMITANEKIKNIELKREDFTKEQKGDLYILSNEKHSLSLTNDELEMKIKKAGITIW